MESMLNKLTMMSNINQPVDFINIDLKQIVANFRSSFSNEIEHGHISFNATVQKEIQFKSYPLVFELMLFNLLENAFFYCRFNNF